MKRRGWLLGGAGAAAAATGLGWQRWRERSANDGSSDGAGDLWQARFAQTDGTELAMATLRGSPLVLNFWATWCPPCIKEMPALDRFARQFAAQGWRVVGLAVDNMPAVREFLVRAPVSYTIALAGLDGTALSRRLGNQQGGLPFTAVFDRHGAVAHRRLGETSFDELARWATRL